MKQLYIEAALPKIGDRAELTSTDRHRIRRVLRIEQGQSIVLADGRGGRVQCAWEKGDAVASERVSAEPRRGPYIELGAAVLKGKRWEWMIEKSVEVGVDRIVPLWTEHVVSRVPDSKLPDRLDRWRTIAIEAFEQCGRPWLPEIAAPMSCTAWLEATGQEVLACCDESSDGPQLAAFVRAQASLERIRLLVGPEGGLSTRELALAVEHNGRCVRLSEHVLRAETAAIAAVLAIRSASES